jgi:two-component system, sensor histidine kinase YesM
MPTVNIKSSIYVKNTLGFLCVMIIIYALSTYLFQSNSQTMIINSNESVEKQLATYLKYLELDLIRTNLMLTDLTVDNDINDLKTVSPQELTPDVITKINTVFDKLNAIENSSSNIISSSVYLFRLEMKLNSDGARVSYDSIDPSLISKIYTGKKLNKGIVLIEDELFIQTAPYYLGGEYNKDSFLLESHLSKSNIIKNINQYNLFPSALSYFIFEQENIVLSSDISEHSSDILQLMNYLDDNRENTIISKTLWGEDYVVFQYRSDFLDARYIQLVPEDLLLADSNRFKHSFILFTYLALFITIAYTTYIYFLVKTPMDKLVDSFKQVENENFNIKIDRKQKDEFSIVFNSFNSMVYKINTLINEVYVQKILNQKSELRQLQSQINPHFLYNSFFILRNRITRKNYTGAEEFCEMLGQYFKYITQNYKDYTTLKDEVYHARIYSTIQATRFSSRMSIDFQELPEKYNTLNVPKLIMQPILENSFKYGLENKEFDGELKVSFEEDSNFLLIHVEDNGDSFLAHKENIDKMQLLFEKHNEVKEPTGLINIHKRIQLFLDSQSGISFSKSELGGLKVSLKLNLLGGYSHDNHSNC